jgi:hypothetical protein
MTILNPTETVMRPASAALEAWFPAPGAAMPGASRAALVDEQLAIATAITAIVARMGTEPDVDVLDDLTEETTALFARAEEIRLALALAARAADQTWLLSLDLD